jgi:hypothetical protein
MTVCNAAPSVVSHAQQEECIKHRERCDSASVKSTRRKNGYCTVIENGKVVVKPIETSDRSCES